MTSQLVSTALDGRPLIRWLSPGGEFIWIVGWAIAGGVIVRQVLGGRRLVGSVAIAVLILYGSCSLAIGYLSVWIPFLPPLLVFGLTAGGVAVFNYRLRHPS